MSSDPNRTVSGDLGEGTGLRDNVDPNLEKVDEDLEKSIEKNNGVKTKPLILIGEFSQIRCHRCGTAKNQEDKGTFMQINEYIAWYHNEECHGLWIEQYGTTSYKSGAMIDQYGKEI